MDVIIFSGQSNMQGQTSSLPSPNDPVDGALEYRFSDDSLVPLCHPCGEYIGEIKDCPGGFLLNGADSGHGSMTPDFCREYVRLTGRRVVAIHAARGGTVIGEWQKGTDRYALAVEKINAGIKKAREIESVDRIHLVWLQGESDAIIRTSAEEYKRLLTKFKNDLKEDVGIERFGIIEVGYFCGVVSWIGDRTREEGRRDDEIIMKAQEELCEEDADFVMLTKLAHDLSLRGEYLNPQAEGHFDNEAQKMIGEAAAKALAAL